VEHKLILGGAQWLPFARSRIKALQQTGLPYASQKFVMPDGANVTVWIEPGQEYLRIDGSGGLALDSGVVALPPSNVFGAGKLYRADGVSQYDANFTNASGSSFTNPASDSGQLDGQLQGLHGRILANGSDAKSFSPKLIPDPAGGTTPVPKPDDGDLATKVFAVEACPSSVFAGRTRMYVQAMYGAWLHPTSNTTTVPPAVVSGNYSAPYLNMPNYKGGDKTDYPQPLALTTSNGVYFDPVQGQHWLIEPPNQNDIVNFYPLVSTKTAEALRKYLRADSKLVLTPDDRTRLEAYILAEALPDRLNAQSVQLGTKMPYSPTNMGYGWHFNWSGTEAAFIKNTTFDQGGGSTAMQATYYKLRITVSSDATLNQPAKFAATMTVSGPTPWFCDPGYWAITEPSFNDQVQNKFLPSPSTYFECSGVVFYAYYNKDTLVECTITVSNIAQTPDTLTNNDYCSGTTLTGCASVGFLDGFGQSTTNPQHWECTITAGGQACGPSPTTHIQSGTREIVHNKAGVQPASIPFNVQGSANEKIGYPQSTATPFVYTTIYKSGNLSQANIGWSFTFEEISTTFNITHRGEIAACAPVFDAEAFFAHATWYSTEVHSGNARQLATVGFAFDNWYRTGNSGWVDPYEKYTYYGYPGNTIATNSTAPYSSSDTSYRLNLSKLFVRGQPIDAVLDISPFFADKNSEIVNVATRVLSNMSGSTGTIVASQDLSVLTGLGVDNPGYSAAIVGWA
jgi:hypothetical protein